jgi:predicted dehydrogenase
MSSPTPLPIPISRDRPLRLAVVGLGQIAELVLPTYLERDDVEVVGLCDRSSEALARWAARCPGARATTALDELLTASLGERQDRADVVDVLVPTPVHREVVRQVLAAGFHVQVQKPLARELEGADEMLAAVPPGGSLRVLEDYLFFPPLVQMKALIDQGEIGTPVGVHMKVVATGRGGWALPESSLRWQFEQALDGRGMMVFDHGWHQVAVATWLFGPIRRVYAWLGRTEIVPGIEMDAPSTLVWEHDSGVRAVLDITFAIDMYFRSSHYTGDERIEVTGSRGYVRTNRISAQGIQEPAVVLYRDGETRAFHDLDDRPPDAFRASTAHALAFYRGEAEAPVMGGAEARHVLAALMAALESNETGHAVDVRA